MKLTVEMKDTDTGNYGEWLIHVIAKTEKTAVKKARKKLTQKAYGFTKEEAEFFEPSAIYMGHIENLMHTNLLTR